MTWAAACRVERDTSLEPTWEGGVASLMAEQCVRCHAGFAPAGGWIADSFLGAVGCTATGAPAMAPRAGGAAPILAALARPDHAGFATAAQRDALAAWIAGGGARSGAGVHGASFADPRSPESHGRFLRARRWAPMFDADDADACGACHDGVASRRPGVTSPADGAPACTSCHVEGGGAMACTTCHGRSGRGGGEPRAYPPRDPCFFPDDPIDRAHAAHAGPSASRSVGLACATCHPAPSPGAMVGVHGNGYVEVWFDYAAAGREARFDATGKRCAGTCHARGGLRPEPAWSEGAMTCNDCHLSPPAAHYAGPCTSCHREANAAGTALTAPVLHANGRVDLGDGSGRCGACHGAGDDPWPATGAHRAHAAPQGAKPVACETCHDVPAFGAPHPVGRGSVAVRLGGLATRGGRRPSYDPETKSCAGTYCHEGSGGRIATPRWGDGPEARACSSCHGSPPPPPHIQSEACGSAGCHEGRTDGLTMTAAGRAAHVDGVLDFATRPL